MDVSFLTYLDPKATRHDARVIERALAEQAQQLGAPRGRGPVSTRCNTRDARFRPALPIEYFMDSVDEVATNFQYQVAATDVAAFVLLRRDLSLKERAIDEVVLEAADPESLLVDAKQLAQDPGLPEDSCAGTFCRQHRFTRMEDGIQRSFRWRKESVRRWTHPGRVKLSWAAADAIVWPPNLTVSRSLILMPSKRVF